MRNLSVTDLERLWILAANQADNSKEGSKKQKIYSELANKVKELSNEKCRNNN